MFGDGNAEFSKAIDLTLDLTGRGMGVRSNRYAMIVQDGVVSYLAVEAPGQFEVSSAEAILAKL
jgi:peroxiredoxin (alkyl hydroperoxide reductase subunit C)